MTDGEAHWERTRMLPQQQQQQQQQQQYSKEGILVSIPLRVARNNIGRNEAKTAFVAQNAKTSPCCTERENLFLWHRTIKYLLDSLASLFLFVSLFLVVATDRPWNGVTCRSSRYMPLTSELTYSQE